MLWQINGLIKTITMNYTLDIKGLSVNEAFKGRRFRTDKYDLFISKTLKLLPKTIEIENRSHIKLAIEFGFSSKASDISKQNLNLKMHHITGLDIRTAK